MADPEVRISIGDSGANEDDVEMHGDSADVIEVGETGADGGEGAGEEEGMTMEEEKPITRVTFVEYVSCHDLDAHCLRSSLRLNAAISNPPSSNSSSARVRTKASSQPTKLFSKDRHFWLKRSRKNRYSSSS